jgi:hypothetical protein
MTRWVFAAEPGGDFCRWCDSRLVRYGEITRCKHCDTPHEEVGCSLCARMLLRTDGRMPRAV